ncbi:MAG TPA: 2-C-methyl-D-erythritol 4-phosphate cytidylyltransferase [Pyrinomonadaceae bacterium]|nr:2-C-methyl-D-erythritol 4-phosphate cytidylyltransferase [Pyrinomonadaceae bacterium]
MNIAIIVAAGKGARAGGGEAKQFRALAGVPLIIHTLRRFEQSATVGETVAVVPADATANFLALAGQYDLKKLARVVAGGETRTESVWRGLKTVRAATAGVVAVHDGVRPFVTAEEIDACVRAAAESGAAVLAAPVVDTIKVVEGAHVAHTLPRETLRRALTPQCFRYELLRRAYEHALAEKIETTDDSALVELIGARVAVVEGDARNIKITRPEDFALAEVLLKEKRP